LASFSPSFIFFEIVIIAVFASRPSRKSMLLKFASRSLSNLVSSHDGHVGYGHIVPSGSLFLRMVLFDLSYESMKK
jgi:hypothetical protein